MVGLWSDDEVGGASTKLDVVFGLHEEKKKLFLRPMVHIYFRLSKTFTVSGRYSEASEALSLGCN